MFRSSLVTAVLVAMLAVPAMGQGGDRPRRGSDDGQSRRQVTRGSDDARQARAQRQQQARQEEARSQQQQERQQLRQQQQERATAAAAEQRATENRRTARSERSQPRNASIQERQQPQRPRIERSVRGDDRPAVVAERPAEPARPQGADRLRRRDLAEQRVAGPLRPEPRVSQGEDRNGRDDRPDALRRPRGIDSSDSTAPRDLLRRRDPSDNQRIAGPRQPAAGDESQRVRRGNRDEVAGVQRDVRAVRRVTIDRPVRTDDARRSSLADRRNSRITDRPGPAAVGAGSLISPSRPRSSGRLTGQDVARARHDLRGSEWNRGRAYDYDRGRDRRHSSRYDRGWDRDYDRGWSRYDRPRRWDRGDDVRFSFSFTYTSGYRYRNYYGYSGWYSNYCSPVIYRPVVYRPVYFYRPAWHRPIYCDPPVIYRPVVYQPVVYSYPCYAPGLTLVFDF